LFEIEVFSNPVSALVGEGSLLKFDKFPRAAAYDELLVKPALLLADKVVLRSHRLDLILNEKRDFNSMRMHAPLYASFLSASKQRDARLVRRLGLLQRDLLTEAEIDKYEQQTRLDSEKVSQQQPVFRSTNREAFLAEKEEIRAGRSLDNEIWEEFWDRAGAYRTALQEMFHARGQSLESVSLTALSTSDIFDQGPWDRMPKSRPREVLDHMKGPNAEFERAYWAMVEEVSTSNKSVMLDSEVRESLASFGPQIGGVDSAAAVGGAVDLMRMVEGIRDLPIDEIIEVRAELAEYLRPFRSFMLEVSSDANLGEANDVERTRLLKIAWETNVEPAIADMRAHVESASFRRNALDLFANSSETIRTVGLAVGLAAASGFMGFSTLTVAGAAAPPLLKAFVGSVRAKQDVKRNRAYFIHAISRSRWATQ